MYFPAFKLAGNIEISKRLERFYMVVILLYDYIENA